MVSRARVIDEIGNESSLRPGTDLLPGAEIYGQNEIYELARKRDELTRVLDRFLPQDAAQESDLESVRRKLEENGARLVKAHERKDEIEARIAELPKLEERARQFKEQGLEEKLRIVPLLARERQLGPRIWQEVERVRDAQRRFEDDLPDLVFMSDKALDGLPHADLLREGRQILEGLKKTLQQKLDEIGVAVSGAETSLSPLIGSLRKAMEESEAPPRERVCQPAGDGGQDRSRSRRRLSGLAA